jgi:hypothetical protein
MLKIRGSSSVPGLCVVLNTHVCLQGLTWYREDPNKNRLTSSWESRQFYPLIRTQWLGFNSSPILIPFVLLCGTIFLSLANSGRNVNLNVSKNMERWNLFEKGKRIIKFGRHFISHRENRGSFITWVTVNLQNLLYFHRWLASRCAVTSGKRNFLDI